MPFLLELSVLFDQLDLSLNLLICMAHFLVDRIAVLVSLFILDFGGSGPQTLLVKTYYSILSTVPYDYHGIYLF